MKEKLTFNDLDLDERKAVIGFIIDSLTVQQLMFLIQLRMVTTHRIDVGAGEPERPGDQGIDQRGCDTASRT